MSSNILVVGSEGSPALAVWIFVIHLNQFKDNPAQSDKEPEEALLGLAALSSLITPDAGEARAKAGPKRRRELELSTEESNQSRKLRKALHNSDLLYEEEGIQLCCCSLTITESDVEVDYNEEDEDEEAEYRPVSRKGAYIKKALRQKKVKTKLPRRSRLEIATIFIPNSGTSSSGRKLRIPKRDDFVDDIPYGVLENGYYYPQPDELTAQEPRKNPPRFSSQSAQYRGLQQQQDEMSSAFIPSRYMHTDISAFSAVAANSMICEPVNMLSTNSRIEWTVPVQARISFQCGFTGFSASLLSNILYIRRTLCWKRSMQPECLPFTPFLPPHCGEKRSVA